jgi:hypothetical protein
VGEDVLWTAWCRDNITDIKPRRIRQLMQMVHEGITQDDLNAKERERVAQTCAAPKSPARKTLDSALKKLADVLSDDQL